MRLTIENKSKLEVFVAIFQLLKNWTSHISIHFESDKLHIQSIDNSHICFAVIELKSNWFSYYECSENAKISVDSSHFSILMNYAVKNDKLEIHYDYQSNSDKLFIHFLNEEGNKNVAFEHFFELNLIDVDEENSNIPKLDYDVEFSIDAKKITDVFSELNAFSSDINIKCSETKLELNAFGDSTKLKVNISVEDLYEYSITENENIDISFSLTNICKKCLSTKISSSVNISLSNDLPISLRYNLEDNGNVCFFVAPKITDN
jgi:proliferating cell nuclear antigen